MSFKKSKEMHDEIDKLLNGRKEAKDVIDHMNEFVTEHNAAFKRQFQEEIETYQNLRKYGTLLIQVQQIVDNSDNKIKSHQEFEVVNDHNHQLSEMKKKLKEMHGLFKYIKSEIKHEKKHAKWLE